MAFVRNNRFTIASCIAFVFFFVLSTRPSYSGSSAIGPHSKKEECEQYCGLLDQHITGCTYVFFSKKTSRCHIFEKAPDWANFSDKDISDTYSRQLGRWLKPSDIRGRFSGIWNTTFGEMKIDKNGNGSYKYKGGQIRSAKIKGKKITGTWIQNNATGDFIFTLQPDGKSFKGEWRTNNQTTYTSGWDGDLVK